MPKSIGISVQPLDQNQCHIGNDFFAITRDISKGGLAFICPRQTTYEMAALSLEDDPSRIVVARVCNCNLLHANEFEEVYLTSVEFLYERRT